MDFAAAAGLNNIAFACALQLGEPASCVDLLLAADRAPEAALFARTFAPSQTSTAVKSWRKTLEQAGKPKLANGLADPAEHVDEFGGEEAWRDALEQEKAGPISEDIEEEQLDHVENGIGSLQLDGQQQQDGEEDTFAPASEQRSDEDDLMGDGLREFKSRLVCFPTECPADVFAHCS